MKEIYRSRDAATVGLLAEQLESAGILTLVRNETLSVTSYPISDFDPVLCVVDEADTERAVEIVRAWFAKAGPDAGTERVCPNCGETSPGNFSHCWKCNSSLGPRIDANENGDGE